MQRHVKGKTGNKRWLFYATDFQSLMYPCFIFCRMLGIFPYNFNTLPFMATKSHYILSTMIACVSCVLGLLIIHNIIDSTYDFGDVTRNVQFLCHFTFNSIMVISTHVLNGPRMRLLQTILEISSKLPPESYQKMSRFIHVKDILGIIFRVVQICINFSKIQGLEMNCMTVLIVMFVMYFNLLVFQINMLYINCVCVLKACFKRINDNLTHIKKLLINDMKLPAPSSICFMQRNQILLIELKTLMKQHLMVNETVQMLNIIFSLQLLVTIVIIFFTITFELYFSVVRWQDGLFFSLDKQLLDVFLLSMSYNIFKIIILVWVCETGKNQAKEIGITIHDLLNSTNDEQLKNELHLFSLQILHCQNTFSAKGLTVDATLLTTIVGNIATYLLILTQFFNMSHSCDGKIATSARKSN